MKNFILTFVIISSIGQELSAQQKQGPLEDLQTKWLTARKRALKPIDDTYLKQLEALKIAETKKGNLELANQISDEQKRVQEEIALEVEHNFTADQMREQFANSMWKGMSGNLKGWDIQLEQGGKVVLVRPDNTPGWGGWNWEVSEDGALSFRIPGEVKRVAARMSKRLDRLALDWENSTLTRKLK
jgi:hypothetical protein